MVEVSADRQVTPVCLGCICSVKDIWESFPCGLVGVLAVGAKSPWLQVGSLRDRVCLGQRGVQTFACLRWCKVELCILGNLFKWDSLQGTIFSCSGRVAPFEGAGAIPFKALQVESLH